MHFLWVRLRHGFEHASVVLAMPQALVMHLTEKCVCFMTRSTSESGNFKVKLIKGLEGLDWPISLVLRDKASW